MLNLSRRKFLQVSGGAALALSLRRLAWSQEAAQPVGAAMGAIPSYRNWEDLYRDQWRWEKVARGTHTNANCMGNCAWNLYVREGIVWREEQSSPYVASNASVPDFNPRGCQKGGTCANLMVGATRQRYPLRRVGPRGAGQWKRVSWDEALGEIATQLVDTLARRGGQGVICELGSNFDYGATLASILRFFRQIGVPVTDVVGNTGDLPLGGVITLGGGYVGGSSDEWFRSRYIVVWATNPVVTRIPDAHFLNEARYRGAQVVSIAPDYNQSSIHADLWISPRVGTDAALALAACQVIVEENLYKADYIREQTDLPFLIRTDTHRLLRESDIVKGGREDRFALWDEAKGAVFWAPGTKGSGEQTLKLPEGVRPALEVQASVRLASGTNVPVRTVFSLLRENLNRFRPEEAAKLTGVGTETIRQFARDFAHAPAALILAGTGGCKNYHSDLMQRSQILLASLTGNLGRVGGGWWLQAYATLEGVSLLAIQDGQGTLSQLGLGARMYMDREGVEKAAMANYISGSLYHTVHAGLADVRLAPEQGDTTLPRPPKAYFDEAIAKQHFPIGAPPGTEPPEVVFSVLGNILRSNRMGQRLRDTMFAKAKLVVDIGLRMTETARYADIVLPAAGWYEKIGFKYLVAYAPYLTLSDRAVPPLGESKPEWELFSLLAQRIAAEATKRQITDIKGFHGDKCNIATLADRFSDNGRFGPQAEEDVIRYILSISSPSKGITLEDLRNKGGAVRITALGQPGPASCFYTEYRQDEPITPLRDFAEKKQPYNTLTGRQQFYIDHPWFIEAHEQLPTHKAPPMAGGHHPFFMTTSHTRWSIHSTWRDHALMLRLQRGEPVMFINNEDARQRGIADHDLVRVSNDFGSFVVRVMPTGNMHPGQVHLFHAWEPFQFQENKSYQSIVPSPIKTLNMVGDYGQLKWGFGYWEPNGVDRDTRVDIAKV